MKLAFSTLGCPGWSFGEIFATAKDLGMDGIEVRGIGTQMYAPDATPFLDENIEATVAQMKNAGLAFSALTSQAELGIPGSGEKAVKEAKDYIDLAVRIGCRYVRVLCENAIYPSGDLDMDILLENYRAVLDYAKPFDVYPIIETNSVLADSKAMAEFIKKVDRDNAFVLWDIHHPYRVFGETAQYTADNISDIVRYVHVKDSAMENGEIKYRMMGYGDVPILDCLKQLKAAGFDSYISLEWLKRWQPDLSEPGIVFSHYENYMNYLMRQI